MPPESNPILDALFKQASEPAIEEPAAAPTQQPKDDQRTLGQMSGNVQPTPSDGNAPDTPPEKKKVSYKKDEPDEPLPQFNVPTYQEPVVEKFDGFSDDDKERIELARFAEDALGENYQGFSSKVTEFVKKHKEFVDKATQEDPDVAFDRHNEEYQKFLRQNDPKIPPSEWKKLEKAHLKWEVKQEVEKESRNLKREIEHTKIEPEVEERLADYHNGLLDAVPEDIRKNVEEKGMKSFMDDNPFEGAIVNEVLSRKFTVASDLLKINSGILAYNPSNPNHVEIAEYIESQGQQFYKKGGDYRKKDGKMFLPASAYSKAMQAGQSNKYWTFASHDVLAMLKEEAKREIKTRVNNELTRLQKAGFSRAGGHKNSFADDDTAPPPAPRSAPRGEGIQTPKVGNPILKSLGY